MRLPTLLLIQLTLIAVESAPRILFDHRNLFATNNQLSVLIRYKNLAGKQQIEETCEKSRQGNALKRVAALQASLTYYEFEQLKVNPNIEYIEESPKVQLLGRGGIESYGLSAIRRGKSETSIPEAPTAGSCSDKNTLKVALVDSGVDSSHPDLAVGNNNVKGASFGIGNLDWSEPSDSHGTGVAGIIGANRDGAGLTGVVDGRSICWIIARVFASSGANADMADVLDGIEWAVEEGARVMNLSLGGTSRSTTAELFYQDLHDRGVVVVAAAGNNGETQRFYPASYETVVSVSAVDHNNMRAFFSQHNDAVNFTAPGEDVLTTAALGQSEGLFLNVGTDISARGDHMKRSAEPENGVSGVLVDCGRGQSVCSGPSGGYFCLIERYGNNYHEQAQNCEDGNGIAAIIYNNNGLDGPLDAEIEKGKQAYIPVIGVSNMDGVVFQQELGETISISIQDGYGPVMGTSYAAPFVSGAIAANMQACPLCDNSQILQCLEIGALDLGAPGRDEDFGVGLVQVEDTYSCLKDNLKCCGDNTAPGCKAKLQVARECLKGLNVIASDACRSCVNSNLPGTGATCEEATSQMCSTFEKCNCDTCQDFVEDYYTCAYEEDKGCAFDCDREPPEPTNSGNGPPDCKGKLVEARMCLASSSSVDCRKCINSEIPPPGSSCDHVESQMCNAFGTCSCGSCQEAIVDYFTCNYRDVQGCPFDCTGALAFGTVNAMSTSDSEGVENLGVSSAQDLGSPGGEGSVRATSSVIPAYLSSVLIFLSGVVALCVAS